jgi:hypothetical protein
MGSKKAKKNSCCAGKAVKHMKKRCGIEKQEADSLLDNTILQKVPRENSGSARKAAVNGERM